MDNILEEIHNQLFFAPFQDYVNISETNLAAYQKKLASIVSFSDTLILKTVSDTLIKEGFLCSYDYNFAKVHPQLQFRLNQQLQKYPSLRNKILLTFGQHYEAYAKEIFQLLLESKKDHLFKLGLEYMSCEFNNFQKALYSQIYHSHPPFFLFACLVTFAESQHFLLNLIDTLEDILKRWRENLPEYPEKLHLHFEGSVINELAKVYSKYGQKEKAIKLLESGLVIFQKLEDDNGKSHILHTLGNQYNALQAKEKAIQYFEAAKQLYQKNEKTTKVADIALNLGEIYRERRQFDLALIIINEAVTIFQTYELNFNYAQALDTLGRISIDLRDFEKAEQYFFEALALFQKRGHSMQIAEVQKNLGLLFFEKKDKEKSQLYFKNYIESLLRLPTATVNQIGSAYNKLGAVSFQFKEYEEALFYWDKAKTLLSSPAGIATLNMNFGSLYVTTQQYKKAIQPLKKSLDWFEQHQQFHTSGKIYQNLGICFSRLEDYPTARDYFEKASQLYQQIKEAYHLVEVQEYLGYTYLQTNQPKEAYIALLATAKGYIFYKRFDFLQHFLKNIGQMQEQLDLSKMVEEIAVAWGKTTNEIWEMI